MSLVEKFQVLKVTQKNIYNIYDDRFYELIFMTAYNRSFKRSYVS